MNFIYVIHMMCWNYMVVLITHNRNRKRSKFDVVFVVVCFCCFVCVWCCFCFVLFFVFILFVFIFLFFDFNVVCYFLCFLCFLMMFDVFWCFLVFLILFLDSSRFSPSDELIFVEKYCFRTIFGPFYFFIVFWNELFLKWIVFELCVRGMLGSELHTQNKVN